MHETREASGIGQTRGIARVRSAGRVATRGSPLRENSIERRLPRSVTATSGSPAASRVEISSLSSVQSCSATSSVASGRVTTRSVTCTSQKHQYIRKHGCVLRKHGVGAVSTLAKIFLVLVPYTAHLAFVVSTPTRTAIPMPMPPSSACREHTPCYLI